MSKLEDNWYRSHHCGEVTSKLVGEEVTLCGWVDSRRDHGGLIFIDLRDRYGLTQIVIDPAQQSGDDLIERAGKIRNEWVLSARATIRPRPDNMVNPKLVSGEIEALVSEFTVLSESKTPPFLIEDGVDASETLRLKYRYLDLRRNEMQKNLIIRHKFYQEVRNYLCSKDFIEVETPILFKSTPEGARDYLVPSRVSPGNFYALPQSPQILKQLLMVSGMDRYFQIARCFRDEDLRADRQPEFTHVDIEMSFANQEMIFALVEELVAKAYNNILGIEVHQPFQRMTYNDAMKNYGVDKPDTRFELKLVECSKIFQDSEFKAFKSPVDAGGAVKGLNVKAKYQEDKALSRKDFDELTKYVATFGSKGLAWLKVGEGNSLNGPIAKFLSEQNQTDLLNAFDARNGDTLLFVADQSTDVVAASLGNLRLELGRKLNLINKNLFHFLWVTEFPLFHYDGDAKRWVAEHHPFTSPMPEYEEQLIKGENLGEIRAAAYDLVINGYEAAGGSIRIHKQEVQAAMFRALKLGETELNERFGFFTEALQYGTPPHGGIAFGLDRHIMILAGTENIRDVLAFPKTQKAGCLMSECPSEVDVGQLTELGIGVMKPK